MKLSSDQIKEFQNTVWKHYVDNKRPMPWRDDTRPYYILLSEIMLQQTQVIRVIDKFNQFITKFPTITDLAQAPLSEVLVLWSGLGYNRRAKFLKSCAETIMEKHNGNLPKTVKELTELPGIGIATASAIATYAYNQAVPYIETNVRTVYIHHFFNDANDITDKQLLEIVEQCHDTENPREWCWAVMDYGTYLKKTIGNLNKKSRHYTKQSKFEGSYRQKRGAILKALLQSEATVGDLSHQCKIPTSLTSEILNKLAGEGMVAEDAGVYTLPQ